MATPMAPSCTSRTRAAARGAAGTGTVGAGAPGGGRVITLSGPAPTGVARGAASYS